MIRNARPVFAVLAVNLAVSFPAAAEGSEDPIARRLVALRALMASEPFEYRTVSHRPLPPAPAPSTPAFRSAGENAECIERAWWRHSEPALRERIRRAIRDASVRFGIEQRLIRAVIRHESAFVVDAVSHAGAQGLMQLMPETARTLGVQCPFDPRENISAGTRYLRQLYDRFGSWRTALHAYNAGPTRVAEGRVPAESRRYARRVLRSWQPRRFSGERGKRG